MTDMLETVREAFPRFKSFLSHASPFAESAWLGPISNGKALEMLSLFSISEAAISLADEFSLPSFRNDNYDHYYLRNEFPNHHEAQAGHEAHLLSQCSLEDRFYASVVPKLTFSLRGNSFMVFREGNPLHLLFCLLKGKTHYKDRPDISIVEGEIRSLALDGGRMYFEHYSRGIKACYEISIRNSNHIPIRDATLPKGYTINTIGVVECSVTKSKKHVDDQLHRYSELFSNTCDKSPEMLVSDDFPPRLYGSQ